MVRIHLHLELRLVIHNVTYLASIFQRHSTENISCVKENHNNKFHKTVSRNVSKYKKDKWTEQNYCKCVRRQMSKCTFSFVQITLRNWHFGFLTKLFGKSCLQAWPFESNAFITISLCAFKLKITWLCINKNFKCALYERGCVIKDFMVLQLRH